MKPTEIYVTKYLFTKRGILHVKNPEFAGCVDQYARKAGVGVFGDKWYITREAALEEANRMYERRIAKLKKELIKLESVLLLQQFAVSEE